MIMSTEKFIRFFLILLANPQFQENWRRKRQLTALQQFHRRSPSPLIIQRLRASSRIKQVIPQKEQS